MVDFYYEVNNIINENIKNKKYDILETKEIINSDKTEIISEIDDVINKNIIFSHLIHRFTYLITILRMIENNNNYNFILYLNKSYDKLKK